MQKFAKDYFTACGLFCNLRKISFTNYIFLFLSSSFSLGNKKKMQIIYAYSDTSLYGPMGQFMNLVL